MGFKSFFIYIIVFSINLSNFSATNFLNNISYNDLELGIMSETKFAENGVKLQYNVQTSKSQELDRVLGVFNNKYNIKYITDKYHFYIEGKYNIEFKLWEEDGLTFVEGFIINENKEISTNNLREELSKVLGDEVTSPKYFKYYKGEIINDNNLNLENISLKDNLLKVQNGYVGKGTLKNKERFSYGIMEYNTGTYIIIGTPIIFTTY